MSDFVEDLRTRDRNLEGWRVDIRKDAYIFISESSNGRVSNVALAKALKCDKHGLRHVLEPDAHFLIEMRGEGKRAEPWYSINPDSPKLVFDQREAPRLQRVIVGGESVKLTKDNDAEVVE